MTMAFLLAVTIALFSIGTALGDGHEAHEGHGAGHHQKSCAVSWFGFQFHLVGAFF